MNEGINVKLSIALDKLYVKDWYLLKNKVHERTITHKLAEYLQELFPDYDVDCEYDYNIENPDGNFKKQFHTLEHFDYDASLSILKQLRTDDWSEIEVMEAIDCIRTRNFYPDIIIHKRGTNSQNLLIIEAKKNNIKTDFDEVKLKAYTERDSSMGNYLKYCSGVLIVFSVGDNYNRERVKLHQYP
jgi:hypothetical protein